MPLLPLPFRPGRKYRLTTLLLLGGLTAILPVLPPGLVEGAPFNMPLTYHYERFSPGKNPASEPRRYTFQQGLTRLFQGEVTIFIDYKNLQLYRFDHGSSQCQSYPLQAAGSDPASAESDPFRQRMLHEISQLRMERGKEQKILHGYLSDYFTVAWGSNLLAARSVTGPSFTAYGLNFPARLGEMWTAMDIKGASQLRQLANSYEELFAANPLLRQLDPLGLMAITHGVPVFQHFGTQRETFTAVREEAAPVTLSAGCSGLP